MPEFTLVLASSSPRRRELLELTDLLFATHPVHIDEEPILGEAADSYVSRLATKKAAEAAKRIASRLPEDNGKNSILVLGADTTVVAGTEILGKPLDRADARRMLKLLSGGWHKVCTGVSLCSVSKLTNPVLINSKVVASRVKFRHLTESEIQWYWETGEPVDKAGGYAIQGRGGVFVEKIEGSFSGIVGLPLCETVELLGQAGFSLGFCKYE